MLWNLRGLSRTIVAGSPRTIVARVPVRGLRDPLVVERRHAMHSTLVHPSEVGGELRLLLNHRQGTIEMTGERARHTLAKVIPGLNRFGASPAGVAEAVSAIERAGETARFTERLWQMQGRRNRDPRPEPGTWFHTAPPDERYPGTLGAIDGTFRLALEMALHEEAERRALEGELAALEAAWREAEEVAAIADNFLLPAAITERVAALREQGAGDAHGGGASSPP